MYNSAGHKVMSYGNAELNKTGLNLVEEIPLNSIMWKPDLVTTKYSAWYYMNLIFLHLFPGLLIDGLLKLSGKKPL